MARSLSKSKLMAYRQCPKRLWLEVHRPELADDSGSQGAFSIGHAVGDAARSLWPGGRLVRHDDELHVALQETKDWMQAGMPQPLFEGTFSGGGVLVRADVVERDGNGARLVEVKATGELKDHHPLDCAIQAWTLEQAGCPVSRVELAHVDTSFVYPGGNDYRGLLRHHDLSEQIKPLLEQVPRWVAEARTVLAGPEPDIDPGDRCNNPYACEFQSYCIPPLDAEYPVTLLPYDNEKRIANELLAQGYVDLRDVPEEMLARERHKMIRRVTASGEPFVAPEASEYFASLPYPRYYIDFETVNPAVPIWAGTRPYQQVPFQWSCHVEHAPGQLEHHEFLETSGQNPLRPFAETLLDVLGDAGPVFMYSHFERDRLREAALALPDLAEPMTAVIERLVDLKTLASRWYCHPGMKGSWSIKAVAPTVSDELDYSELGEVQDGGAAAAAYLEMLGKHVDAGRRSEIEANLRCYCALDTKAMVRLVGRLKNDRPSNLS